MSATFAVRGGRPLVGTVRVPGDKSISHRALMLAAVARGTSHLRGLSEGDDVHRTGRALAALGAGLEAGPAWSTEVSVEGVAELRSPGVPIDVGNSGTTMRLLAGLVAPYPIDVTLTGDDSLRSRPMDRVAVPLRAMGAVVEGREERCLPPLHLRGGPLRGIDYTPPMASAQVKSCVLLAGLGASGPTVVREATPTRLHTEELLTLAGAALEEHTDADGTHVVTVQASTLDPLDLDVPGDPSQAAFWVVAATVVPGSDVTVEHCYAGPARRGFLDVLTRMGASVEETPVAGAGALSVQRHLRVRSAALRATEVHAAEITGLDEVPALAVAAALAEGTTAFRAVGELRVKESDRFTGVVELVRSFGGSARAEGDDLLVDGTGALRAGVLDARGDHRMAMAGAVAALAAPGESTIRGWEAVATSYPGFGDDLVHLGGEGALT
ncbi:MAG TPA: 3-phosphoshikimate 1-carboxyvinyltransferase [Acidimicrobiales bacterium]|nr:3-phosphoshikimate 1-carboxyvinyltransferase [Acidimicrobiales bacterium]